ncbi:hypothetical protein [Vibrio parahaemolyticus]|uniref:hypothetical protein n=1 Tax=Vibrio parahaemolyticus TaxID=670 RepID=UPI00112027DF|nr:hypothetical protein [Vibrio parahaemolyticus]TOI62188.1 hypothetical protein CGI55_16565 [Vibrio parahaemolyticus]
MPIIEIEEPEELRNFRQKKPKASWNQLKADRDVNHVVKVSVLKKTGGLCVYCEHKLVAKCDYQIEHYYPKKGNDNSDFGEGVPNRAIQWENLLPGCLGGTARDTDFSRKEDLDFRTGGNRKNRQKITCGQKKKETEPEGVFIEPTKLDHNIPIFIFNDVDGSVSINEEACEQQEIDIALATSHVTRLNLNSPRLNGARLALSTSLRKEFDLALSFDEGSVDELVKEWLKLNNEGLYDHPFISLIASKYKV